MRGARGVKRTNSSNNAVGEVEGGRASDAVVGGNGVESVMTVAIDTPLRGSTRTGTGGVAHRQPTCSFTNHCIIVNLNVSIKLENAGKPLPDAVERNT